MRHLRRPSAASQNKLIGLQAFALSRFNVDDLIAIADVVFCLIIQKSSTAFTDAPP